MIWYEKNAVRLALELEVVRRWYPKSVVYMKNGKLIILHKFVGERGTYTAKIVYPDDFPASQPEAYAIDPDIRGTEHNHPKESNCLCLFRPEQASPSISGKQILDWTGGWFLAYEEYLRTGTWPRGNV